MTNSTENPLCTCPSGDGSLLHPCPMHPHSGESELKVGDVLEGLEKKVAINAGYEYVINAINLIKSQQKQLEASHVETQELHEDKRLLRETIDVKSKALDAANAKCDELLAEIERLQSFADQPLTLSKDGNQWCVLYGANLQEGISGFGDSHLDALIAFSYEWLKHSKSPLIKVPDGWKLMPLSPSSEMILAAKRVDRELCSSAAHRIYDAVCEASPKPEEG